MGEGELQENFEKDALFEEGTEKWQKNMNIAVLSQGLFPGLYISFMEIKNPLSLNCQQLPQNTRIYFCQT